MQKLNLPDATIYYAPHFFGPEESDAYFQVLEQHINWQQERIKMFGRELPMPRLTAWYGDRGYTYSGLYNAPQPWTPALQQLKEKVELASGHIYNSVLLNLYRSGNDSMGWHADNEPELGEEPAIASLSFGGERRFSLKHRTRKDLEAIMQKQLSPEEHRKLADFIVENDDRQLVIPQVLKVHEELLKLKEKG